jgi:protein-S-isoprenylcysteine O-methyltransferase Ste14
MQIEWPALVLGVIVIVAGSFVVRYRVPIARANAAAQRFEAARRSSTPAIVLAVGVFFICFGLILLLVAFL